jgi:hypothetical protein
MALSDYIIRAALHEETNDGWVWMCGRDTPCSRTVVAIRNPSNGCRVYTEVRKIEDNFLTKYHENPRRIPLLRSQNTIVMAEWYREALGIGKTDQDNKKGRVQLCVKSCPWWGSLRAACHHPDPVVRLGTRLGVLGTWLGLVGIWLGILSVSWAKPCCQLLSCLAWIMFAIVVASCLLGLLGCRGRPRPARKLK